MLEYYLLLELGIINPLTVYSIILRGQKHISLLKHNNNRIQQKYFYNKMAKLII
jgi:hypothetical protein